MVDPQSLYVAATGALLLVALGIGVHVLRNIVGDAREIRRRRRSGELERNGEEAADRASRHSEGVVGDDAPSVRCPRCGAANDAAFDYCRRCASPLRPGA
ncbi:MULTISPECIES: zinc ribbon domain-containing protein [Halorubrum]|uniref:Zinc ribbon domain-containing protein n=1 Tax=Halorubrum persicum TaxID=1383844 RepID=A0A2G1WHG0_9EURY|nr:zinc ribbon domain-containing protein [Halorubrum persicum]PHQ38385.1 zinc ribbon domain-containing protein [Halorubrum persicum]